MRKTAVFIALLIIAATPCPPSAAQQSITEEAVLKFYSRSTESYRWPFEDYLAFLQDSVAEDFAAEITTTIRLPQQPPAKNTSKAAKDNLLQDARKNYDAMQSAELENEVVSIRISRDGKTVTVEDKTVVRNMKLPTVGAESPTMDGGGTCHDTLILTSRGKLQLQHSRCICSYEIRQEQDL